MINFFFFFFSSRRRHTRLTCDWSSDVCSSDLVPTAANAGYYARIVRERAILRRLVEVGTRIVQLGYSGDGEADDLVDQAQAEVYAVTDRRVSEDYLPLSEIMPGALDEIEAIGSHGGRM